MYIYLHIYMNAQYKNKYSKLLGKKLFQLHMYNFQIPIKTILFWKSVREWRSSNFYKVFSKLRKYSELRKSILFFRLLFIYSFMVALGFELRAYTLSHSPALYCDGFFWDSLKNYLPGLASNFDSPDLCLLSS
jgi:hypothetical protein